MAHYTDAELDSIKRNIDLVALVQSKGIQLQKHGSKDLKGLCPFHADKNPSLIISPAKNLWHCPSCNKGGDVIRFVQDYDGVSFRHAVEFLRNGSLSEILTSSQRLKQSTVPKLKTPVELNVEDQRQLHHVIHYYHQRLLESEVAQEYLKKRGLWHPEAVMRFQLGYADRTLGLRLPERNRKNGTILREQLQRIGIYRDTGREHFNGCLVIPIIDENNRITEIYGRKLSDKNVNKGLPSHLYLPGPHQGLWNPACLKSKEIILCEALIDALTFWVNGFHHVTASYGTAGFTSDHLAAFVDHRIEKVYIAYDRDEAGNKAAQKVAAELGTEGVQCYRVNFPHRMDANSYARQVTPPAKALETLLRSAAFMGNKNEGKSSTSCSVPSNHSDLQPPDPGAAKEEAAKKEKSTIPVEQNGDDLLITLGDRRYRIRGLERNTSFDILKVNIRVNLGDFFHVDTLDLYNARHRKSYIHTAAEEIKADPEILKRDIGRILLKLEELQEQKLHETLEVENQNIELSDEEKQQALDLLRNPQLLERIANDFELVGLVGERSNALVAYLAAASRKTDDPLAVIIQSSSSAGKSSLMDAVLDFVAEEDLIRYTAMTGQSLFYMGETQLAHKILAISEEEGAEQATYALKILQSEKRLRIASTGKDPKTGRLVTQEYVVEGPCMIFMTTTTIEIDEELQNRCILLTVNEDRDQTRRIHELQRQSRTLDGLLLKEKKNQVLRTHRNAQRLLKPILVANPFAEKLTFLDSRLRTRRDHIKYLNLINAVALLHQYQRPLKTVSHNGKLLSYIEVTVEDIEAANQLAAEVMGISLDDIAPQTRKLLLMIYDVAVKRCDELQIELQDLRLTRREIREATGWGNTQLGIHLDRLVEHEYLVSQRGRGRQQLYELLYRGEGRDGGRFLLNLIDLDRITNKYDATSTEVNSSITPQVRGTFGASTPNVQSRKSDTTRSETSDNNTNTENRTENHLVGTLKPSSSYLQIRRNHKSELLLS